MSFQTLPQPFQIPEGLQLQVSTLADFERFYRSCLRRVAGQRIRSPDLARNYANWAEQQGAAPIGFKAMKRCMELVGHQLLRTNGMFYLNVGLATDFPEIFDNLAPIDPAAIAMLAASKAPRRRASLDAVLAGILAELAEIRSHLVGAGDQGRAPHGQG